MAGAETAIVRAIHVYLLAAGFWVERFNVGAAELEHRGRKRFVRFGPPGFPDLLMIGDGGRFVGIEVKTDRGRLSQNQKHMRDRIEAAGGLYIVARSIDDVRAALANSAAADEKQGGQSHEYQ